MLLCLCYSVASWQIWLQLQIKPVLCDTLQSNTCCR